MRWRSVALTRRRRRFGSETPTHELDFDRFYAFIGSLGVLQSESEARALFDRMDLDRNGLVDYIEWTVEDIFVSGGVFCLTFFFQRFAPAFALV